MSWFFQSIAKRLIFIISLLFLFAFVTLSFFLYHILLLNYQDSYNDFFHNETAIIRELMVISGHNIESALKQEIILEPDVNNHQYYIQIKKHNEILIETPGISKLLKKINKAGNIASTIKFDKKNYAVLKKSINIKTSPYRLYMLLDITQDTKILEKVRHSLMLISLLFTLIFLCIGIFLVKIGLSPLNKFIQKIKKLTPNRLDPLDLKKLPLELNQLLIEINSLIVRIKYSHEALSSFSSNIAHELRTPINNLMISNERFLEKNVDLNQINELTTSNLEEYQRLSNLIDKLLFLAKLSADNKQFNFSTLDINKEIKKVIEFHEALAEEKVINIIVDAQGFICADKDLFHNALSNILTNAIKYSPSNSNITIISKESGHQNIISIIDEGYGLPEEEIERITTRYYRFYKKENTSSGLGLGLSIVNSIMKALNAQLEIQLNEDVGITVKMIFHAHN